MPRAKGERRLEILKALAQMLEAPKWERITTAALAERLDVSEAALYRHFASKAQMYEGLIEFIESSRIPLLTINLLQALPRTPLYDRLKLEGRLIEDEEGRESNVAFRMDYDEMLAMWRDVMGRAFAPATVFARYQHQVEATYPIEEIKAALAHAGREGRRGKILVTPNGPV